MLNIIQAGRDEGAIAADLAGESVLKDTLMAHLEKIEKLESCVRTLESSAKKLCNDRDSLRAAISGNLQFKITRDADIEASDLNAAAAGGSRQAIFVELQSDRCALAEWANIELTITTGESVADADVSAPTVLSGPISLANGKAIFHVEMDTDADATKHYTAGDTVDVTVKVASDDKLLGHTIPPATVTYTVV